MKIFLRCSDIFRLQDSTDRYFPAERKCQCDLRHPIQIAIPTFSRVIFRASTCSSESRRLRTGGISLKIQLILLGFERMFLQQLKERFYFVLLSDQSAAGTVGLFCSERTNGRTDGRSSSLRNARKRYSQIGKPYNGIFQIRFILKHAKFSPSVSKIVSTRVFHFESIRAVGVGGARRAGEVLF